MSELSEKIIGGLLMVVCITILVAAWLTVTYLLILR
jgi:hypothetical protein